MKVVTNKRTFKKHIKKCIRRNMTSYVKDQKKIAKLIIKYNVFHFYNNRISYLKSKRHYLYYNGNASIQYKKCKGKINAISNIKE